MPDPASDPTKLVSEPPVGASPPTELPNPAPPPQSAAVGRLLRVLVEAGADTMDAYNVAEEAQSMALESAALQVQPMLAEMRQLFAERDRKLDDLDRKVDALAESAAKRDEKIDDLSGKIDALAESAAERDRAIADLGRDLHTSKEVVGTKLDALKRELRLVWGALGVLITLLIAVFGFAFSA